MKYNEEYFEKIKTRQELKLSFTDGSFGAFKYDTFLPVKDNDYDAILVRDENDRLVEINIEEIEKIEIVE